MLATLPSHEFHRQVTQRDVDVLASLSHTVLLAIKYQVIPGAYMTTCKLRLLKFYLFLSLNNYKVLIAAHPCRAIQLPSPPPKAYELATGRARPSRAAGRQQ